MGLQVLTQTQFPSWIEITEHTCPLLKKNCPILMYCSFISFEAKLEGKKLEKHGECVAYVALFMVFAAHVWLT